MNKLICTSVLVMLMTSAAFAQGPGKQTRKPLIEMNIDMPDETQEPDLVGKGIMQIETAYLHNFYKEGKRSAIGQGLFRYGLSDYVELRLLVEAGSQLVRYMEETVQSTYPAAASAKIRLLKDRKNLPDISLISYLQLPVYKVSKDKKAYWSPIFIFAFQNEFGEKWKLEYNVGVQQQAYSTQWAWIGNTSVHYKLVEQLEVFAEYFAQYQNKENPQHNLGGGLAYQLNNYLELFAMAGGTVNYEQSNHYINGGVAFRLP